MFVIAREARPACTYVPVGNLIQPCRNFTLKEKPRHPDQQDRLWFNLQFHEKFV